MAQLRPPAFAARVAALEYFDPGDRDTLIPLVLKLEAPELKWWAERITAEAERRFGIEPVRHPEGYNPHVTIAKVPERIELPAPPAFSLRTEGIVELHARKLAR